MINPRSTTVVLKKANQDQVNDRKFKKEKKERKVVYLSFVCLLVQILLHVFYAHTQSLRQTLLCHANSPLTFDLWPLISTQPLLTGCDLLLEPSSVNAERRLCLKSAPAVHQQCTSSLRNTQNRQSAGNHNQAVFSQVIPPKNVNKEN